MAEFAAETRGPRLPPTEARWHDEILADTIGYTKGLVAILDSLNERVRRRDWELEEQRQRLAVLQNKRRTVFRERAELEEALRLLRTERDALRPTLEARDREINQLQHSLAQAQATLEARSREIQQFQTALAESARQAEGLREVVREAEREREGRPQSAARLAEMERELLRLREAAAQAQQEEVTLRDRLASREQLLEAARRDLGSAHQLIETLRTALEEERSQTTSLQESVRSQGQELSRLDSTGRASRRILTEIAGIVGGPADLAGGVVEPNQEAVLWAELVQAVRRQAEMAAHTQEEIAALRPVVDSVRQVLGATDALPERLRKVMADRVLLERRIRQIAAQWQRLRQEQAASAQREQQLREETQHLTARVAALTRELEAHRAQTGSAQPTPTTDRQPPMGSEPAEAAPRVRMADAAPRERGGEEDARTRAEPVAAAPSRDSRPEAGRPAARPAQAEPPADLPHPAQSPAGRPIPEWDSKAAVTPPPAQREPGTPEDQSVVILVECAVRGRAGETYLLLRGQASTVSEAGLLVTLAERLPGGRPLTVRLIRGEEEFLSPASIVRIQASPVTPATVPGFDHLIRFEHPSPDSAQRLKAFLA